MSRQTNLSLELLHTFLTLVRNHGDGLGTARQLGITRATLGKRLGLLEQDGPVVARPWLTREDESWALTEEGARVLPAVEEVVYRYEQLRLFAEQPAPAKRGIHFGCGQLAAASLVHQAVALFRAQYPDVRLRIATLRGQARIERVANGSLDLATVTHDEAAIQELARRELYTQLLATYPLVLVSAPDAPWAEQLKTIPCYKVKARSLVGLPLILPEPDAGTRKRFDQVMDSQGLLADLDVVLEIGGWSTLLAYVHDGVGVGVVSSAAVAPADGLIVRPLDAGQFAPTQTRLIARRRPDNPSLPDLTPEAQAFHDDLLVVTKEARVTTPVLEFSQYA